MFDELDVAYYETFRTSVGQQVMDDLLAAYWEVPLFDPSDINPQSLAFREGQRSVILFIRACIRRAETPNPEPLAESTDPELINDPF